MTKTDHWRPKDHNGSQPYEATERFKDRAKGGQAGPKITREEFEALRAESAALAARLEKQEQKEAPAGLVSEKDMTAAIGASEQKAEAARKKVEDKAKQNATEIGTLTTIAKKTADLAQALDNDAKAAQSKSNANAQAINTLQAAATKRDQAAQKLNAALEQATKDLNRMDEVDAAIGRLINAFAKIALYDDPARLAKELGAKGVTEADLKLFGLKK